MIKAVIFDLDGTLCDTMEDLLTAMNAMLRSFGWPERTRGELLRFINRGARAFVADSMPEGSHSSPDDEIVSRALKVYNDCYAACYGDKTVPYEGMKEALIGLSKKYALGVLSNKQEPFVRLIIDSVFPGIFTSVHGNADGVPTKPDPRSLDRCLSELGAEPSECVFVGDSDVDMRTGNNAGMISLGVLWGYRDRATLEGAGAAALCEKPADLPAVIGRLGAPASSES